MLIIRTRIISYEISTFLNEGLSFVALTDFIKTSSSCQSSFSLWYYVHLSDKIDHAIDICVQNDSEYYIKQF